MGRSALIILIILSIIPRINQYGIQWSRNNVLKFTPVSISNFENIHDYENIDIGHDFIQPSLDTNSWIQTCRQNIGDDFVLTSSFINFTTESTDSFLTLKLINSANDDVISEKKLNQSGKIDLVNVFNKNIYLQIENKGKDIKIYSFGLVRRRELVATSNDIFISPPILFFEEENLKIDFSIRFPANLDVIIFDKNGKIIDYIAKNELFSEGSNILLWDPSVSKSTSLISSKYLIYFKIKTTDGKETGIVKDFIFVKD